MNFSKLFNNQSTTNQVIRNIVIIGIFFSAGSVLANYYGVHFNLSNSFKEKVFIVKKQFDPNKINRFDLISTYPPIENNYVPKGEKIIKQVVCVPGQSFVTRGADYYCDGHRVAIAQNKDSKGKEIARFNFTGVVPKDNFFIVGDNPKSYDSRYFGFVERKNITGVALWRF